VECQLHSLRRCKTEKELLKKLNQMPPTLNDTYHRIIQELPKDYKDSALRVLQILAVSFRPLSIVEAVEALAVDEENGAIDPRCRMPDPYDILDICSSLVTVTAYDDMEAVLTV
jgi:hypothetical protein